MLHHFVADRRCLEAQIIVLEAEANYYVKVVDFIKCPAGR
jgi:hypothetical protein